MIEVREYNDVKGSSPYAVWFNRLNAQAAAQVATALTRLAGGNFSSVKGVSSGVFECRIDFGPGYRVYFGKDGNVWSFCWVGAPRSANSKTSTPPSPAGRITSVESRRLKMPLTRDFKETIRARAARDAKFRKELLRDGVECMLSGDTATAKTILRDYINATVGFAEVAEATRIPSKSLMRMLGPRGNPRAGNLFEIVSFLQDHEGVRFRVRAELA